jgi:hypothetical protein
MRNTLTIQTRAFTYIRVGTAITAVSASAGAAVGITGGLAAAAVGAAFGGAPTTNIPAYLVASTVLGLIAGVCAVPIAGFAALRDVPIGRLLARATLAVGAGSVLGALIGCLVFRDGAGFVWGGVGAIVAFAAEGVHLFRSRRAGGAG